MFEHRPVPKNTDSKRIKRTQRQKGDINEAADRELKARSGGICELCAAARATERAHIVGRKHIKHKTTALDLLHLCTPCHDWLDETPEGIRARRLIGNIIEMFTEGA